MDADTIRECVSGLDTTNWSDSEAAWEQLRGLGAEAVPYLAEAYPSFRRWQGRTALLYYSIKHGRTSDIAYQLAISALQDRSYMVRYRACGVLAYSLRRDALPALQPLLGHDDERTREHATAAIDAIRHQNHHYFIDRNHSGRSMWVVTDEDRELSS